MKRILLLLLASIFTNVSPAMAHHRSYRNYSRNAERRAYYSPYGLPFGRRYGGFGTGGVGFASPFVDPSAVGFGPYGN